MTVDVVFLGSGGCIRVPTYSCTCQVCEEARQNNIVRTRASIALLEEETTIIDASPDLPSQLEREGIRKIDNMFITHWHFDHVWGLAELVEPSFMSNWAPVDLYIPEKSIPFFDEAMGYMRKVMELDIHPVNPGDTVELTDMSVEVVKTNHSPDSVGYILDTGKRLAYLLDSYIPCEETIERISEVDILVLGATIDRFILLEGEKRWPYFDLEEAYDFWKRFQIETCIFSHLSCHNYINGKIMAGLLDSERKDYERQHLGLKFAFDGFRFTI